MTRTKYLKGECQYCAGHLEFPVEMAGLATACPHCGEQTELLLATPPEEPSVPRRTIVWAVSGIVVLSLGLVGALLALKRAERWAARQKRLPELSVPVGVGTNEGLGPANVAEDAMGRNGLVISGLTLEKTPGSSRLYAVGKLRNNSNQKRFGIRLELDLFDAADQKLGTATDYQAVLEPGAEWSFKALVLHSKAASVKIASIKEDQ